MIRPTFIAFGVASALVNQVSGGYDVLQVLFNNGESYFCVDQWDNCCNSTEWNLIASRAYTMAQNQRDLDGTMGIPSDDSVVDVLQNSTTRDGNSIDVDRELVTYPRYCANRCKGYAPGRCLAMKCRGYRQRRTNTVGSTPLSLRHAQRDLFYSTGCSNQISEMKNLLRNIRRQLGRRCRSLLNAPRKMTCFNTDDC